MGLPIPPEDPKPDTTEGPKPLTPPRTQAPADTPDTSLRTLFSLTPLRTPTLGHPRGPWAPHLRDPSPDTTEDPKPPTPPRPPSPPTPLQDPKPPTPQKN
ncbi:uncharacterized protein [Penaeus vannamei]|uniref:uncharacterized protein n=1 Tax=Penaeus vannamei TaxID=6689 RepID=UPI00387F65D1